ncbi:MAG TPA: peptidoglycan DD-metalloendopeptidase family protein [Longimicrobiaceae bacterium]|nr:peptidoglycan DD-metalloendopeptidase family protein [Longimicrobiaceae bacterium]
MLPRIIALLGLLMVLGAAGGASAQVSISGEISESQKRLEEIRRERERLRHEMTRIRSRVHDLASELDNLERQVETSASLLSELEYQTGQARLRIRENTRELISTEDHLAERKAILYRRLRDIYKRGPLQTAQVLLSAESFSDLLNRYKYLFLIARHDRLLVQEVAELERQIHLRETALRASLSRLEELQTEKAREYIQLANLREQQERTLGSARSEERTTAQRIEQLEQDEKRLVALLAELERRRIEAERLAAERRRREAAAGRAVTAEPAAATLTTADLGSLAWPVEGNLLYNFGRETQPNGTVIRWNGIGIAAAAGTPVTSVEAGTVVMAGPFEGYGPTVVLSHGGGYYSLYLYLGRTSVAEGAVIAKGATVGTVGGELTPEGAHVEFQIRAPGGQAVDPLAWLRNRGR